MRTHPIYLLIALLSACSPDYSPNTYNSSAVQQAAKVEQGVVIGVRQVGVRVSGNTGTAVGGAAGAIAGSQLPGSSATSALGALGGTLIGGVIGSGVEHSAGDTDAYEYVVRTAAKGELVSVTQTDTVPLDVGQRVLVIAGSQARIVPDYTISPIAGQKPDADPPKVEPPKVEPPKPEPPKPEPPKPETAKPPAPPIIPPTVE